MGKRDQTEITPALYQFMVDNSVREPEICKKIRQKTAEIEGSHLMTSAEQMQFVALLVTLLKPKKCLEIGVFTGYSTVWTALHLREDACLIALERFPYYTDIAKQFFFEAGVMDKIDYRLCHAREMMETWVKDPLEKESFDFIFLDANKREYPEYYQLGVSLLRKGGLMVIDNMFCFGEVLDEGSVRGIGDIIRELNHHIHKDNRVQISTVPLGDGLTCIFKR